MTSTAAFHDSYVLISFDSGGFTDTKLTAEEVNVDALLDFVSGKPPPPPPQADGWYVSATKYASQVYTKLSR